MKLTQITKIGSTLIVSAALFATAKATPINGEITVSGKSTVDTGKLATATTITSASGVVVAADGSYSSVPLLTTNVTYDTPITFTPSPTAPFPLWSFTLGATTYSFEASGPITIDLQTSKFLDLSGTGWASITGWDTTPGIWSIQDTTVGSTISFGADTAVPDSGATALLIGLGLAGIAVGLVAQRRLARA